MDSHTNQQQASAPLDIEFYIRAAQQHGMDSEPDHEVGDLQDMVRVMWRLLPQAQREAFSRDNEMRDLVATALCEMDDEDDPADSVCKP